MDKKKILAPESTSVRTALWRALHIEMDMKPYVFHDDVGMKLVDEKNWRQRQDMEPNFSKSMRASMVGRARFIEDLVEKEVAQGVRQYVILGAGIDTFVQRRTDLASKLQIFEIDQPGPQKWKQKRLIEIGYDIPEWLHFVPVDLEEKSDWMTPLINSGFDQKKPAIIVSTGVSMYLTKEANFSTFKKIAKLAPGSTFATTFMLTLDLLEPKERGIMEFVMKKAEESGTPFLSLFSPKDIMSLAIEAGFKTTKCTSGNDLYQLYFASRSDGLRAGEAEAFLIAVT